MPVGSFNAGRVRVYSLENCPRCEELKEQLKAYGIPYEEVDMGSPKWITEMRCNGCFYMEAPVMQIAEDDFLNYFTALERLNELK